MTPLINGVAYASTNITAVVPLVGVLTGIIAIDYEVKQDVKNNYSFQQDPTSRAFGQNTYTASIEVYKEQWNKVIDASPLRDPMKLPLFDITVVFGGGGTAYRKEVLRAVSFANNPMGVKGGDTKITCKIDLIIAGIDF
jgi:hypothetical protein